MPIHLDISDTELLKLGGNLDATEKQVRFAFSRAIRRTAGTLRKMSEKGFQKELELRTIKTIRKRLKTIKLRRTADGQTVGLWYGLNDMAISQFKGRPAKTTTGASFRGVQFPGGFTGRNSRGQPTIFKRQSRARLPIEEQALPIKDKMDVFIEDHIFVEVEQIFWKHFIADLKARVMYDIGQK